MNKQILFTALTAILFSAVTFLSLEYFIEKESSVQIQSLDAPPVTGAMYTVDDEGKVVPMDFEKTAAEVMPSVVYIKSIIKRKTTPQRELDPFRRFFERDGFPFGEMQPEQPPSSMGSGSGVIINEKGYIVTNNHVIDNASEIEVTLNDNRSFKASVVGTDPNTDLALLQIKAEDLNAIRIVNSDDVNVGQWVMAVGNPFNLTSTATAGIVSAKARNININANRYAIESFIQTDAAINRGNSGGALVNLEGQLIGINTALISPTGTYSGYGFAIPSNIVTKVVSDLLEYGSVQRGYLGVMIQNLHADLVKSENLSVNEGVWIDSVMKGSAADEAGLIAKDIIIKVDGSTVSSSPELQEKIASHRPGEDVKLTILREGKTREIVVVLKNQYGEKEIVASSAKLQKLGIEVENLSKEELSKYNVSGGAKVTAIRSGIVSRNTNMREGFIITKINDHLVKSSEDFIKYLDTVKGGALVEGFYPDYPGKKFYGFGLDS